MSTGSIDGWEYNISTIISGIINKFTKREDIIGVLILDEDGFPLKSNLPPEESELISAHASNILQRAIQTIKAVKNAGELNSITIETSSREIIFTPDKELPLIFAVVRKLR